MDNVVFKAFDAYFNRLGKFGYVKDKSVLKLILLAFTLNFMHTFQDDMSDEDRVKLDKLFSCIQSRDCLIPDINYHSLCN